MRDLAKGILTTETVQMKVDDVMSQWRPGSQGDDWTWEKEYDWCWSEDNFRMTSIIKCVQEDGIGFDDKENPILLGNDGRVWDGHHRILIAKYLGVEFINVEVVPRYYSRYQARYLKDNKDRERAWDRNDWLTPVNLIIWEHVWFHNDIPFNGDNRPIKEKVNA